jgi:hypothetical protein
VDAELPKHEVVLYFGHGRRDSLGLHKPPKAIIDDGNVQDVREVLVAIACSAGSGLGVNNFSNGHGRAFLGFDNRIYHPARTTWPVNFAYEIALSEFLEGVTLGETAEKLKDGLRGAAQDYLDNHRRFRLSKGEAFYCFFGVRSNIDAVACLGNGGITI